MIHATYRPKKERPLPLWLEIAIVASVVLIGLYVLVSYLTAQQ